MSRQVALVTGGSMGLGQAVAERFALDGMEVVTCARSGQVTYRCDVSELDEVERMVRDVLGACGRIDVLVCNAAVYGPVGPLDAVDPTDWWEAVCINLLGPMLCCRAVLPIMRRQGFGKIVAISGAGTRPQPECTAYNASKAGLLRFTEALAAELPNTGIDVNAVAPGVLDTRMRLRSQLPDDPAANMQRAVDLIAWLASSDSNGVTGRLFSAVWDDWRSITRDKLSQDDYRMRRVVPAPVPA